MKSINLLFIAITSLFITSCTISSEEKIEGNWDLKLETNYYNTTETNYGSMFFHQDGTGSLSIIESTNSFTSTTSTSNFTWEYDEYDQLMINDNGEIIYLENSINTYNQQVFFHSEYNNGINIRMTFTLTK